MCRLPFKAEALNKKGCDVINDIIVESVSQDLVACLHVETTARPSAPLTTAV